ncbi:YphA family membrane protein [Salirhabdus sp. Marseille-P4669]|uniref:YphA family membrane protein n=1 Tax=Salirhabdus sp. Marseille-P4669 TaxID=2042310 RepID=UPI000C7D3711|nr:hypothetical protein [Salirhabdus sp. Marseille-P4669]
MEKGLFLWFIWLLWIILYFFEFNKRKRTIQTCIVLIGIICSNQYIVIMDFQLFLPLLYGLLIGFCILSVQKKSITMILLTISLSFFYSGLKIWELLNPLWLFVSSTVFWTIVGFTILSLFTPPKYELRIGIWLVSTSTGHLIYSLIRNAYGYQYAIGDYSYLVDVVFFVQLLTVINKLGKLSAKIEQSIQNVRLKSMK